jgi:uncharacterized protein (DUF305 family)
MSFIAAILLLPVAAQADSDKPAVTMQLAEDTGAQADKGFMAAMAKMHEDSMGMTYTGDADIDFVKAMIPHHQGAIDMAEVELKYGRDPEIRKLAEAIIKAQENEIAMMKAWLKGKGQPVQ